MENLTVSDVLELLKEVIVNNDKTSGKVLGDVYEELGDTLTVRVLRNLTTSYQYQLEISVIEVLCDIVWENNLDADDFCDIFDLNDNKARKSTLDVLISYVIDNKVCKLT